MYIYIFWHSLCSGPGPAHSARSSQCEVRRGAGTQVDEKRIEARRRRRKRRRRKRSCTFVRNLEALTCRWGAIWAYPLTIIKQGWFLSYICYLPWYSDPLRSNYDIPPVFELNLFLENHDAMYPSKKTHFFRASIKIKRIKRQRNGSVSARSSETSLLWLPFMSRRGRPEDPW